MNTDNTSSGSAELSKLLAEMNQAGNFNISVLTDRQGLPIAFAAAPGFDPDRQSAVVAIVQKTAAQASTHLGLITDEISLAAADGQRLVCRPFEVNGHMLILAIMLADRTQTYRRLTSQTIHKITGVWKSYWE